MSIAQHRRLGLGFVMLAASVLAGCQSQAINDEDSTGRLGDVQGQTQAQAAAAVYVQLAAEYMRQRQLAPALQNARKAVIVSPRDPGAHNILALIYQQLGESEQAEQHFVQALKLDPQDPYANNAYGSFLCGKERYDEALSHFDAAVANPLNPEPWVALTNGGLCNANAGNADQAETYLRKALRANPKVPAALLRMGQISYDQGKYLSARAYLQRYLEVAPHTPETLWLGIRTERQLGDMDQVASYELLLRSKFPDSEPLRYLKESR